MLGRHIFAFQKSDSMLARNRPAQFDCFYNSLVHSFQSALARVFLVGKIHKMYVVISVSSVPKYRSRQMKFASERLEKPEKIANCPERQNYVLANL